MIGVAALIGAAGIAAATPAPADRQNIALSTAIVQRVGDSLWPKWAQTPFQIDLLTSNGPALVNVPKPFAPPPFPRNLEATVILDGGPIVVIGQPQYTQAKTPVRWSVTLLHEHFHQWQQSWPEYTDAVTSLNLARGDKTGMWMLNYAFPYGDARVDAAYALMSDRLADALDELETPNFGDALAKYLKARAAFKSLLSLDDYRYFAFQCWQEGTARYTEIAVARLAVQTHESDPSFLNDLQASALREDADRTYAGVLKRLRSLPLAQEKRVDFYAVGAGEAFILDHVAPSWREQYLDSRMDLGRFLKPLATPWLWRSGSCRRRSGGSCGRGRPGSGGRRRDFRLVVAVKHQHVRRALGDRHLRRREVERQRAVF